MIAQQEIYNEELNEEIYEYIKKMINLHKLESQSKDSFQNFKTKSLISNKLIKSAIILGGFSCIGLHLALLILKFF